MKLAVFLLPALIVCLAGCSPSSAPRLENVDLEVLLDRMDEVRSFAEPPLGPSFLESSYDRTGGNQDWMTYPPVGPGETIPLFEAEGPGYVSRFWIASFAAERWLFYFDGEEEPRLDLAKDELFGERFPFVPPLAGISGGGRYSLLPLPFKKSLRIEMVPADTLKASDRNYFQINYTHLDMPRSRVESFPPVLSAAQSNRVREINASWEGTREVFAKAASSLLEGVEAQELKPGEALTFWEDEGLGVLDTFAIRLADPLAGAVMTHELLRKLRLRMAWDGFPSPSVDVPLGDFFFNGLYTRSFTSLPLGRVGGTYVSRFPMPYQSGARCWVENRSDVPVRIVAGASGNREDTEGLERRFHALWRASASNGRPFTMLKTPGPGHYVGCYLTAIGQDGTWTILEGDEVLRPDPGDQPVQHGTGLEDYFNGAYYYTSLFDLPLHGLIEKGAMRTDQYRLHLLDLVPFEHSFDADIEFGHGNRAQGYLSSVMYWYAEQPQSYPLNQFLEPLLERPQDRFELQGMMSQLFLLERDGLHADAAARVDFLADRFGSQPWADLLRVRAAGYREQVAGLEPVRASFESLTGSAYPAAAAAARDRLWLEEDATHGLLGIHALGRYRVWQDEVLVAEGEGRNDLRVERISVEPGAHRWEVEMIPTHQGSFFSLCLRTREGDVTSAGPWETVSLEPLPGQAPPDVFEGDQVLPNMTVWAFQPNAYVGMQSPAMCVRIWSFWARNPVVKQVRLAKTWDTADLQPVVETEERERSAEALRFHAIN